MDAASGESPDIEPKSVTPAAKLIRKWTYDLPVYLAASNSESWQTSTFP